MKSCGLVQDQEAMNRLFKMLAAGE